MWVKRDERGVLERDWSSEGPWIGDDILQADPLSSSSGAFKVDFKARKQRRRRLRKLHPLQWRLVMPWCGYQVARQKKSPTPGKAKSGLL